MASEHASSTGGRKFGRNFSRRNLPKPSPAVVEMKVDEKKREKTGALVEKRQSKLSLFELFSKPKVERARGFHETSLEALPERSQTPTHFYRMPDSSTGQPQPSRRHKEGGKAVVRPTADWNPPPLFQAYPQAIKHGIVRTINVSTETLIRVQQYKAQTMPDPFGSSTSLPYVSEDGEEFVAPRHPPKRFSTIADNLEITGKVFVLVPEGRLVQYEGDGNIDRSPEKILQLGPRSAAFACDLIPGKHWVLQVVQAANEDGAPTIKQSRSLLSKLRIPSSAARKSVNSCLMVLDSAEEMDSWLKAIKRMIEQLGGKKVNPDLEPSEKKRDKLVDERPLSELPSHQFLTQRAPNQSQPSMDREPPLKSTHPSVVQMYIDQPLPQLPSSKTGPAHSFPQESPRMSPIERDIAAIRSNRITSTESTSVVTTNASVDQLRLEQLRESSRYSYISTRTSRSEAETIPTSMCSSSPPSPLIETFADQDQQRSPPSAYRQSMSNSPASSTNRRSMLAQSGPVVVEAPHVSTSQNFPPNPNFSIVFDNVDRSAPLRAWPAPTAPLPPVPLVEVPRSRPRQTSKTQSPARRASDRLLSPTLEEGTSALKSFQMRSELPSRQSPNLTSKSHERLTQVTQSQPRTKPFMRPLPVKPSEPQTPASNISQTQPRTAEPFVPRRFASLQTPPALSLASKASSSNRFSRPPSLSYSLSPTASASPSAPAAATKPLRRPNSMQIRSDPAPFLSASRPRAYSRSASASPISFRVTGAQKEAAKELLALMPAYQAPPIPEMNPDRYAVRMKTSMPTISIQGLPPPAPPPNIPLPVPPSV
jgi:hypothetical protein